MTTDGKVWLGYWRRAWPAIVTFALPGLFVALVLDPTVKFLLPPKGAWTALDVSSFSADAQTRFAHDIEGRLLYGVTSGLSRLAALAAVVLAGIVLVRRFGRAAGVTLLIAATLLGVAIGKQSERQSDIRARVLEEPLAVAQRVGVVAGGTTQQVQETIVINLTVGIGGTAALLAAFAAVAVPARRDELTARDLRQRMRDLQWLTLCSAAILVLLVVVNKVLLAWPQGLMTADAGKSYGVLAAATANYWGAQGTSLLICALAPALLSLKRDIDQASGTEGKKDQAAIDKWRKENGLNFAPVSVIGAAVTTAAPLLTGPIVDVVGTLLEGG